MHYDYTKLKDTLVKERHNINLNHCDALCDRLLYFADNFQKQFKEKLCNYEKEAAGTLVKCNSSSKFLQYIIMGIGGTIGAVQFGFPAIKCGMELGSHSDKIINYFDTHKNKAKNVTLQIQELCKEVNADKLFIKIAIQIFMIYEEQFVSKFNEEMWLKNKETLITDAIKRIINTIEENISNKEEIEFETLILKSFSSSTKCLFKETVKDCTTNKLKKSKPWTFNRLNKKAGFIKIENDKSNLKQYFYNLRTDKEPFGFKLSLPGREIDDLTNKTEYNIQKILPYEYILDYKKLDDIVDLVQAIIKNYISGDLKDIHSDVKEIKNLFEADKAMKRSKLKFVDIIPAVANFTGREDKLKEINEKLTNNLSQGRILQTVCICGMGGMGKTELSRKYIETYSFEYDKIFWIDAEDSQNISEMEGFYENEFLLKISKGLVIFDNAHTFDKVEPFFPKTRFENAYFLITSRSKIWDAGLEGKIEIVDLSEFKEAFEFIIKCLPEENHDDIEKLITELHNLPLALQQAVSFIKGKQKRLKLISGKNYTILDYLNEFKSNSKMVLNKHFAVNKSDQQRYLETVYTTWNVTIEHIKNDENYGEDAVKIMRIISYIGPNFSIRILIKNGLNEDAILLLNEYTIINIYEGSASIHRLVQEVIRLQAQEQQLEADVLRNILIFFNDCFNTFDNSNPNVICEYLLKYPELVEDYCKNTPISKIPFNEIIKYCTTLFELIIEREFLNWNNEVVQTFNNEYLIIYIIIQCNVNVIHNILKWIKLPSEVMKNIATLAQIKGRVDVVEYLTKDYEELDQFIFKLFTLLHSYNGEETLSFLNYLKERKLLPSMIKRIQDLYTLDFFDYKDILRAAINIKYPGILKILLENGAEPHELDHLVYAMRCDKDYAFQELVTKEYLTKMKDYKDNNGENAFDYVCCEGELKMVKHFLNLDFKRDLTFHLNYYLRCNLDVFNYLLSIKDIFDLNKKDELGRTTLFYAVRAKRMDLVKTLVENGLVVENVTDNNGNSLLHYAVSKCKMGFIYQTIFDYGSCNIAIVEFLLKNNVNPSKCNSKMQKAFFFAAYYYYIEAIELLLQNVNINDCDYEGRTALHYAVMKGQYKSIKDITIKCQSSYQDMLNIESAFDFTHFGFFVDRIPCVETLLKLGANKKVSDKFGCTPLHYACMFNGEPSLCELLNFDACYNERDLAGNTPLHYAAITENMELLNWFAKNSLIKVVNNHNQNLLHFMGICKHNYLGCQNNYEIYKNVIKLLIDNGLNVNDKDDYNHTPLDYAHLRKNEHFIQATNNNN